MPAAQATITTGNAASYLTRLCTHAGKMGTAAQRMRIRHRPRAHAQGGGAPPQVQHIEQTPDEATITLDCGRWTLRAQPGQLTIRAEAPDQANLQRIQDLLTRRVRTLAHREQLTITWQPAPAADPRDPAA